MAIQNRIVDTLEPAIRWAFETPMVSAPILVLLASYVLYGVLGKKYLGADDDYWEKIRGRLIPVVESIATGAGGYVKTTTPESEFAGYAKMSSDELEKKLQEAGYLRQVVASIHYDQHGRHEDGSWAKMYGPLYPLESVAAFASRGRYRVPVLGEATRRFIRSLNTILALKQHHIVLYEWEEVDDRDDPRVDVYCHSEWNPINPFTAALHYSGGGAFEPSPDVARRDLESVGVPLTRAT